MLACTHQLNLKQLSDLDALVTTCHSIDGSVPNTYPHLLASPRELPVNGLYYYENKLVGFISVFFFYEDACEISLLVDPAFRRRGVAKQLLQAVLPFISARGMETLLFSNPHQLNSHWLLASNFRYHSSEYHMERQDSQPLLVERRSLVFAKADLKHLDDLCRIDAACFPKEPAKTAAHFASLLKDKNYQLIVALKNAEVVAKAHIRWQENRATLSDIGVIPRLQAQGLGSVLLAYCINAALAEGKNKVDLDVETKNLRALNLYLRFGFVIQNACDYWAIPLKKLLSLN